VERRENPAFFLYGTPKKILGMQELIDRLKSQGLSNEQAENVITTIRTYVVEKYPMLEGAVNNIFGED
jgi:hypothetical protein